MQVRRLISLHAVAGPVARALALLAMLVQFAFYADHIGAVAVKALGKAAPDARFGFMEICTGNGIEVIALGEGPVDPSHDCPICENASVMAFGEPVSLDSPIFDVVPVEVIRLQFETASLTEARFPGPRPIRGPPVMARA
ncbi:hypothetical protein [Maritimibacter sp. HL-12]|jgi:hypothetical protein|uniref:hypothetical protein n=1 Tax=Maritimibacter sp. HL-12 TaxID=1162418 RepID=UPI000A0EF477|nr:hypothetical protein [Maritimibacter sp. HL-12]SMH33861.1 hypothetical protein SAMN05661107_0468 [Maritimibacter sp. HL-12]